MKTRELVPALAKGENAIVEGHLVVRVPMIEERFSYRSLIGPEGFAVLGAPSVEGDANASLVQNLQKGAVISKLFKASKEHIVEVKLKRKSDGSEISTYEDLASEAEYEGILIEVAMRLLDGFKVSEK